MNVQIIFHRSFLVCIGNKIGQNLSGKLVSIIHYSSFDPISFSFRFSDFHHPHIFFGHPHPHRFLLKRRVSELTFCKKNPGLRQICLFLPAVTGIVTQVLDFDLNLLNFYASSDR